QYTAEKPVDPLAVHVYGFAPADAATARVSETSLYEDDGVSNDYRQGAFQRTSLRLRQTPRTATVAIDTESGKGTFHLRPRNYRLYFHGLTKTASVKIDGKAIPQARTLRSVNNGSKPSWSVDTATGEISVFVPRTERRAVTVEVSLPEG